MNKKLALAFLIISFLVIGGAFEKAAARELRSGMDLLKICTKNLPFEVGKKIDYHSLGQCQGFIESVAGALSNQIFRENIYQLSGTPLPPREFCIPKDITVGRLNGKITDWLQKDYKINGNILKIQSKEVNKDIVRIIEEVEKTTEIENINIINSSLEDAFIKLTNK